jgi:hypothetical protein
VAALYVTALRLTTASKEFFVLALKKQLFDKNINNCIIGLRHRMMLLWQDR